MRTVLLSSALLCLLGSGAGAQNATPSVPPPARVDISPAKLDAEVGQTVKFTATAFDGSGTKLDQKPSAWFVGPFDSASADESGSVTFYYAGEIRVGAIVGGKPGFAQVTVKPQAASRLSLTPSILKLSVGSATTIGATALTRGGDPLRDAVVKWSSSAPAVATVDDAGFVTAAAPGSATLTARSDAATATVDVQVTRNTVTSLSIEPHAARGRTGDVLHFKATVAGHGLGADDVRWSVSGTGATVWPDGGFVAEQPGSYVVTASSGDRSAAASIVVTPRNVARPLELVGRTPLEEFQSAEQWIVGKYAYLTSIMAGRLWVYDISNPAAPLKVDSVAFDARMLNDVSTTADGKITVVTREAASNRKNGIVFLDTSDQGHPKVVSEYTETVSGGVHSAFVNGHYVYLTDDATGSLRVIDFRDVKAPKEVARWQVENELAREVVTAEGPMIGGRYLHDVQVVDGLLYAGYWRDGLVILDVGKGIKGGSPEHPKFVSQLRMNYHELYGPGWLAGAHAVFRYKQYVFVGDEVLPAQFDLVNRDVIPVKGMVHVIDVSDIEHPRKVATYEVPEGGSHNMWVDNDVMYMGYYSAGARVVDVSGELRGDLYRQGREIARLWTGDPKAYRANAPFCWGAQPHDGLVFFNDLNSGIWITRLGPAPR
jgi:plastocyanin